MTTLTPPARNEHAVAVNSGLDRWPRGQYPVVKLGGPLKPSIDRAPRAADREGPSVVENLSMIPTRLSALSGGYSLLSVAL
jgi:hypothetical protein